VCAKTALPDKQQKNKLFKEVMIIFDLKTGKVFLMPPNSKGETNYIYLIKSINV